MKNTIYAFITVAFFSFLSVGATNQLVLNGFSQSVSQFCSVLVAMSVSIYFIFQGNQSPRTQPVIKVEDVKPLKKFVSAETRRKISEKAIIREKNKREQKARFEKTRKVTEAKKKRASVKK